MFTNDDTRAQRFLADPVVVQAVEEMFAKSAATPCSGHGDLYKYIILFTIDDGLMSFRCEGSTQTLMDFYNDPGLVRWYASKLGQLAGRLEG